MTRLHGSCRFVFQKPLQRSLLPWCDRQCVHRDPDRKSAYKMCMDYQGLSLRTQIFQCSMCSPRTHVTEGALERSLQHRARRRAQSAVCSRGAGPTVVRAMALNMGMLASNDQVRRNLEPCIAGRPCTAASQVSHDRRSSSFLELMCRVSGPTSVWRYGASAMGMLG